MRLKRVEHGHSLPRKLILGLMHLVTREPAWDVIRTLSYRPELFGRHYSACLQEALRGPSDWSVGERELFAGFVSRKNQCPF